MNQTYLSELTNSPLTDLQIMDEADRILNMDFEEEVCLFVNLLYIDSLRRIAYYR